MRDWIKPELVVEEFELSQHVASGCGIILGRRKSVSFTVYGKKEKESGTAYDGNDANDYLDAAELQAAVLAIFNSFPPGHQAGAYYTIDGKEYNNLSSSGSWPFSS